MTQLGLCERVEILPSGQRQTSRTAVMAVANRRRKYALYAKHKNRRSALLCCSIRPSSERQKVEDRRVEQRNGHQDREPPTKSCFLEDLPERDHEYKEPKSKAPNKKHLWKPDDASHSSPRVSAALSAAAIDRDLFTRS